MRNIRFVIGALCMLIGLSNLQVFGHPGGNLLVIGDQVLWSYVDPIDSTDHMACVMIKSGSDRPEILLRSEHSASDFFLSSTAENVFIIERYYIQQDDSYKMRVFEMPPGENPKVIWDWQSDTHRIGEAGFFMPDAERILFVKYPSVWEESRNELPVRLSISDFKFVRIRALKDGNKLLISDSTCHLFSADFKELTSWKNLTHKEVENAPLNRNTIFDADYSEGKLLVAYWGNRSFDLWQANGREQLIKLGAPRVPHWVAFYKGGMLLFDSEMRFDGSNPSPNLYLLYEDLLQRIWHVP